MPIIFDDVTGSVEPPDRRGGEAPRPAESKEKKDAGASCECERKARRALRVKAW